MGTTWQENKAIRSKVQDNQGYQQAANPTKRGSPLERPLAPSQRGGNTGMSLTFEAIGAHNRLELGRPDTEPRIAKAECRPDKPPKPLSHKNRPDSNTASGALPTYPKARKTRAHQRTRSSRAQDKSHKGTQQDIATDNGRHRHYHTILKSRILDNQCAVDLDLMVSMILPQVHLRKPCYDFAVL